MKVLILSCNTGQGHNSAGLAVKEELQRRVIAVHIGDHGVQHGGHTPFKEVLKGYDNRFQNGCPAFAKSKKGKGFPLPWSVDKLQLSYFRKV